MQTYKRKCQVVLMNTHTALKGDILKNTVANILIIHEQSNWIFKGPQDKDGIYQPQHLYIVGSEVIKDGDWFYVPNQSVGFEHISNCFHDNLDAVYAQKIIASTDLSLDLSEESYDFMQEFIKSYILEYNDETPIKEISVDYSYDEIEGSKPIWKEIEKKYVKEDVINFMFKAVDFGRNAANYQKMPDDIKQWINTII